MSAAPDRSAPSVALAISGNVLLGTGLIFHAFLYNFYLEALHHSTLVMGHAAAALTAGGLLAILPAGALTDRVGPRAAVSTAAGVLGIGLALGAVTTAPAAIYAAAALAGLGSALWRVAMAPILMRLTTTDSRARAFAWNVGLLVAWGGLGTALAGASSGWLEGTLGVARLTAIRWALIIGALGSGSSFVLFRLMPLPLSTEHPGTATITTPRAQREGARRLLPLALLVGVWMLGPALAAPFFNLFFNREHGLSIEGVGTLLGAASIGWAAAVIASGELARRVGVSRLLVVLLPAFAPAMAGLSVAGSLGLAATLFVCQGLVAPVTNALIDQWLLGQTPPDRQGTVSSWRQAAADGSAMAGASLGGYLLTTGSFGGLFLVSAAVGAVGAMALIAGVRMRPVR
jgi:MFS family permease